MLKRTETTCMAQTNSRSTYCIGLTNNVIIINLFHIKVAVHWLKYSLFWKMDVYSVVNNVTITAIERCYLTCIYLSSTCEPCLILTTLWSVFYFSLQDQYIVKQWATRIEHCHKLRLLCCVRNPQSKIKHCTWAIRLKSVRKTPNYASLKTSRLMLHDRPLKPALNLTATLFAKKIDDKAFL